MFKQLLIFYNLAYINIIYYSAKITNNQQIAQIKNAKLVSIVSFEKQKLKQIVNIKLSLINDDKLNTNNIGSISNMGDISTDTDKK